MDPIHLKAAQNAISPINSSTYNTANQTPSNRRVLLKLQKDQVTFDGDTSTMSENGRGSDLLIRSYDYKTKVNQSAPKYTTGP